MKPVGDVGLRHRDECLIVLAGARRSHAGRPPDRRSTEWLIGANRAAVRPVPGAISRHPNSADSLEITRIHAVQGRDPVVTTAMFRVAPPQERSRRRRPRTFSLASRRGNSSRRHPEGAPIRALRSVICHVYSVRRPVKPEASHHVGEQAHIVAELPRRLPPVARERRVLLGERVHLGNRARDLAHSGRLLVRRGRQVLHRASHVPHAFHDLLEGRSRPFDKIDTVRHLFGTVVDERLDIL